MAAVSVLLVGFFALVIGRVATPSMSVLYSDLSNQDASAIVRELAAQNIPHALTGDGTTIQVPDANIAAARMSLAEIGLPAGGSLGYEIFDKAQSFGTSSFLQNVNHLRAMEGELSRTISSLRNVAQARVHLAIPERQLFVREQREPTASIVLKVRGQIEKSETRAIQHLVSSAVEGLKPSRVSIVDETGRLLASGSGDGEDGLGTALLDEREQRMESRLRDQVNEIVSSVVGPGRARVQMSVDLDYNRVTQTSDTFDPDGQVVRSTQSRTENNATNQPTNTGAVGAAAQLPNGGGGATGGQDSELSEREEETVNYEISKTSRTQITEAGSVSRLSVAVLVDGRYTPDGNGSFTYAPRDDAELAQIASLVRSAVGFSADRGDTVEVVNLRFHQSPDASLLAQAGEPGLLGLAKADLFKIAEWVVLFLMTAIVSLVAIRPLIRRVIEPEQTPLLTSQEMALQAEAAAATEANVANQQIADAVKDGELQAETMAQVGALIEEKPAQASAIVRSWAAEAA
ncbi:MAG: flagellar basal-body MS-ring/collar protein FliF [Pseudomonadota bacterium]